MSKYIPSERADSKYLPLSSEQINALVDCYKGGFSAREAALIAGCASASVWRYWRMFRMGERPKAYDPHSLKHRKPPKLKSQKPLNNEARFYRSTFEPT